MSKITAAASATPSASAATSAADTAASVTAIAGMSSSGVKLPIYQGPAQFFELRVPDGEGTKLVPLDCVPGQPLDIAEDHPVALALTACGFLVSAPVTIPTETE